MLRSSLGFHTVSLFLRLDMAKTQRLVKHFYRYKERTGIIRMRIPQALSGKQIEWKEYTPIYSGTSLILPHELRISYSNKDQGIKWTIRADKQNEHYKEYGIEVKINPKILSGIHDYITAATCDDLGMAIFKFDQISRGISPILLNFEAYTLKRIDYCINLCVNELFPMCTANQIMDLIRRGDIPRFYKEWKEYDIKSHRKKASPDSFYLINKSATINCYRKSVELQNRRNKGMTSITEAIMNEAQDIIRFEVQCMYSKVYSISRVIEERRFCLNKYHALFGYQACLKQINHYYKVTVGTGDWYSLSAVQKIIKKHRFNKQKEERLLKVLQEVRQCRSLAKAKANHQGSDLRAFMQTVKDLADIGINPVTIPREWGIKHIPNLLHTFNDMDQAREVCPDIPLI